MAGDWIKMRVWLAKDPRVIAMADFLSEEREFMDWLTNPVQQSCKNSCYEHVTRNVTVALCVTALLVTWGTAREQGDREDDDLVLQFASFSTLDAMTDLPCFGYAMAHVGWAEEHEIKGIRFPKFFKDNESPDDKHKRQAAERQAKFRGKQSQKSNEASNEASNVTVTHREEKRRVLKTNEAFASFWAAYPKKKNKGQAEKAFAKVNPDNDLLQTILKSVEGAARGADWIKNDGQYIPFPATWLNARGWEDETPGSSGKPWEN